MKAAPDKQDIGESPTAMTRVARSSAAIRTLAILAIGTFLYFAHAVVIPVVLAILFALILTAPVEALHRFRIPRIVTALALLLAILGLLSGAIDWLSAPAEKWWDSAPQTLRTIERKLQPVSKLVNKVEQLTDRAGHLNPSTQQPTPQRPAASTPSEGNVAAE